MALNLARRPFVDTRPVNALTALLVVVVVGLSVESFRTLRAYVAGSRGTQASVAELRTEISRYEDRKKAADAAVARYDLEELGAAAEDANDIARRRSFSWTRFLTRVEETLPHEVRIVNISLVRSEKEAATGKAATRDLHGMPVQLQIISRDPLGLPRTIRAFYSSPWFDMPVPQSDQSPERAGPEGRRITLSVEYLDEGRKVPRVEAPAAVAAAPRQKRSAR